MRIYTSGQEAHLMDVRNLWLKEIKQLKNCKNNNTNQWVEKLLNAIYFEDIKLEMNET